MATNHGYDIKVRLMAVGKTQADVVEEINANHGIKTWPPQVSMAISNPHSAKLVAIRGIINELLQKWEAEAAAR